MTTELAELVRAWDAYVEATAGRGHRPEAHNRELASLYGMQASRSTFDDQQACSACAGAEYGAEADLAELFEAARARLAALTAAAKADYMCPNCVTPWKCNWPHFLEGEVPTPMEGRPPPDDAVGA